MRNENVTVERPAGLDLKAIGYLTSIVSVLFLGAVAWAKEDPPGIIGMGFRYLAHLRQKREIEEARSEAKGP